MDKNDNIYEREREWEDILIIILYFVVINKNIYI